jgi:threonine dehydratase
VLQIDSKIKTVCTHSSGNHAQALAYAAKKLGLQAKIVMPKNSP